MTQIKALESAPRYRSHMDLNPRHRGTQSRASSGIARPNGRIAIRNDATEVSSISQELRGFLLLTAVIAPALAVAVVTGYGFLVWMYQLFAGPPGS